MSRIESASARVSRALTPFIKPFVEAKLRPDRRTQSIDIFASSECRDADVRGVCDDGVEIFFINATRIERWLSIRKIGIASHGADGFRDGGYREIAA